MAVLAVADGARDQRVHPSPKRMEVNRALHLKRSCMLGCSV